MQKCTVLFQYLLVWLSHLAQMWKGKQQIHHIERDSYSVYGTCDDYDDDVMTVDTFLIGYATN